MQTESRPADPGAARDKSPLDAAAMAGCAKLHRVAREAHCRAFTLEVRREFRKAVERLGLKSDQQVADYLEDLRQEDNGSGARRNTKSRADGVGRPTVWRFRTGRIGRMCWEKVFEVLGDLGADVVGLAEQLRERARFVHLREVTTEMRQARGLPRLDLADEALAAVLCLAPQISTDEVCLVSPCGWEDWRRKNRDQATDFLRGNPAWGQEPVEDLLTALGDWVFVTRFLPQRLARQYRGNAERLFAQGDARAAERLLRRGVHIHLTSTPTGSSADRAATFRQLAYLLRRTGRPGESEGYYRRAEAAQLELVRDLAADPACLSELGAIRGGLARLLQETGKLDRARALAEEAQADLVSAVEADRREARHRLSLSRNHWVMALILRQSGKCSRADWYYREALALRAGVVEDNPDDPEGHNELAWLLATFPDARHQDPAGAVRHARRAVELTPGVGNYLNTLGVAYYREGQFRQAVEVLERARAHHGGGNAIDWLFLAMALQIEGDTDRARRCQGRAARWIASRGIKDEEVWRFRDEAAAHLGASRR